MQIKTTKTLACVVVLAYASNGILASAAEAIKPQELRCEYLINPLGIDETKPRVSWQPAAAARGQNQTAYQILVASSTDQLAKDSGDLWDTGQVTSDQSIQLAYGGKPLVSGQSCYWKVRIWDKDGKASAWSKPAEWSMGLLESSDWKAEWIGHDISPPEEEVAKLPIPGPKAKGKTKRYLPSPHLRKEFKVSRSLSRATLHVTAQGVVEMHLNGNRVGNEFLLRVGPTIASASITGPTTSPACSPKAATPSAQSSATVGSAAISAS